MRIFKQTYRDRQGQTRESSKWYGEFRDHLQRVRRLSLFTDRRASEEAGRRIEVLVSLKVAGAEPDAGMQKWLAGIDDGLRQKLARFGLLDVDRMEAARPLVEHLEDWKAATLARGTGEHHAHQIKCRVLSVLVEGCGFEHYTDIKPGAVRDQLTAMREDTYEQVNGERKLVRRGNGPQTTNHTLGACKSFCRWMVRENRATSNPLAVLAPLTEKAIRQDQRHARRIEPPKVVARLIETTASEAERFGMTGPARALLYRLAVETGLRRQELASLTRLAFRLDSPTPHIAIDGAATKNGKGAEIPLLPETAELLREHLADKLPMAKAFNMPILQLNAEMLRTDLAAAGIEYQDGAGRFFDFHSFRHCTATYLADRGVHPNVVRDLMRHASLQTTLRYFKATAVAKRAEALAAMPDLGSSAQPALKEATSGESLTSNENAQQNAQTGKAKVIKPYSQNRLEDSMSGLDNKIPEGEVPVTSTASEGNQSHDVSGSANESAQKRPAERPDKRPDSMPAPVRAALARWADLPPHIRAAVEALLSPFGEEGQD